jgi:hypothetical protein
MIQVGKTGGTPQSRLSGSVAVAYIDECARRNESGLCAYRQTLRQRQTWVARLDQGAPDRGVTMLASCPSRAVRDALSAEKLLLGRGAINANHALPVKRAGFSAIYSPAAAQVRSAYLQRLYSAASKSELIIFLVKCKNQTDQNRVVERIEALQDIKRRSGQRVDAQPYQLTACSSSHAPRPRLSSGVESRHSDPWSERLPRVAFDTIAVSSIADIRQ